MLATSKPLCRVAGCDGALIWRYVVRWRVDWFLDRLVRDNDQAGLPWPCTSKRKRARRLNEYNMQRLAFFHARAFAPMTRSTMRVDMLAQTPWPLCVRVRLATDGGPSFREGSSGLSEPQPQGPTTTAAHVDNRKDSKRTKEKKSAADDYNLPSGSPSSDEYVTVPAGMRTAADKEVEGQRKKRGRPRKAAAATGGGVATKTVAYAATAAKTVVDTMDDAVQKVIDKGAKAAGLKENPAGRCASLCVWVIARPIAVRTQWFADQTEVAWHGSFGVAYQPAWRSTVGIRRDYALHMSPVLHHLRPVTRLTYTIGTMTIFLAGMVFTDTFY